MTPGGGTVTFDAEEYAKAMDELKELLTEGAAIEKRLRDMGLKGFSGTTTRPPRPAKREKNDLSEAMTLELDISGIDWQTKDKTPAGPDTPWCWAFSETKNGGVIRETMQLLQALEQYGTVRVGKYLISLGGRDNKLLNRRVVK